VPVGVGIVGKETSNLSRIGSVGHRQTGEEQSIRICRPQAERQ